MPGMGKSDRIPAAKAVSKEKGAGKEAVPEKPIDPRVAEVRDRYVSPRLRAIIEREYLPDPEIGPDIPLKYGPGKFDHFLNHQKHIEHVSTSEYDRKLLQKFVQNLSWNPENDEITLTLDRRAFSSPTATATRLVFLRSELGNMAVFSGVRESFQREHCALYKRLAATIKASCLVDPHSDPKLTQNVGGNLVELLFKGEVESVTKTDIQDALEAAWGDKADTLATAAYLALTLYFDVDPTGSPPPPKEVEPLSRIPWYMNHDRSIKQRTPGQPASD